MNNATLPNAARADAEAFIVQYENRLWRLVMPVARSRWGRRFGEPEDLFQEIALWLLRTADGFDASKASFITYVWPFITPQLWSIVCRRSGMIRVPAKVRCTGAEVEVWLFSEGHEAIDLAAPEEPPGIDIFEDVALRRALGAIDPRDRTVIEHRFGLDGRPEATLGVIGERLGVSRERVRQLEERALGQLPGLIRRFYDAARATAACQREGRAS